jgi:plasmid replication initiation protein
MLKTNYVDQNLKHDLVLKWENRLVEASFKASGTNLKLLLAFTALIDENAPIFEEITVSVIKISEICGFGHPSRDTKKAVRELVKMVINISRGADDDEDWWPFFSNLRYNGKSGTVTFLFQARLRPLLLQVRKAYTQAPLAELMSSKGMYTNRFKLFFAKRLKLGKWFITFGELRDILQIDPNKYNLAGDIWRRIVVPSIKEINQTNNKYTVVASRIKNGRRYVGIEFKFVKNETVDTIDVPTNPQVEILNQLISYGIGKRIAVQLVRDYALEDIVSNIEYTQRQQTSGKVTNLAKYLRAAIMDDYAGSERAAKAAAEAAKRSKMTPEQRAAYDNMRQQIKAMEEAAVKRAAEPAKITSKDDAADKLEALKERLKSNKGKTLDPEPMPEQPAPEPSLEDSLDTESKARLEAALAAGSDAD